MEGKPSPPSMSGSSAKVQGWVDSLQDKGITMSMLDDMLRQYTLQPELEVLAELMHLCHQLEDSTSRPEPSPPSVQPKLAPSSSRVLPFDDSSLERFIDESIKILATDIEREGRPIYGGGNFALAAARARHTALLEIAKKIVRRSALKENKRELPVRAGAARGMNMLPVHAGATRGMNMLPVHAGATRGMNMLPVHAGATRGMNMLPVHAAATRVSGAAAAVRGGDGAAWEGVLNELEEEEEKQKEMEGDEGNALEAEEEEGEEEGEGEGETEEAPTEDDKDKRDFRPRWMRKRGKQPTPAGQGGTLSSAVVRRNTKNPPPPHTKMPAQQNPKHSKSGRGQNAEHTPSLPPTSR